MIKTIDTNISNLESLGLNDEEILMHYRQEQKELISFDNQLFKNLDYHYFYTRGLVHFKSQSSNLIFYLRLEQENNKLTVNICKYISGNLMTKEEKEHIKDSVVEVLKKYYNLEFDNVELILG